MSRFQDALRQLARRGHFSMEPREPVIRCIPMPPALQRGPRRWAADQDLSANRGAPTERENCSTATLVAEPHRPGHDVPAHLIQVAAALPPLRFDFPPIELPKVVGPAPLISVEHGASVEHGVSVEFGASVEHSVSVECDAAAIAPERATGPHPHGGVREDRAVASEQVSRERSVPRRFGSTQPSEGSEEHVAAYRPVLARWALLPTANEEAREVGEPRVGQVPEDAEGFGTNGSATPAAAMPPAVEKHFVALRPELGASLLDLSVQRKSGSSNVGSPDYDVRIRQRLLDSAYREHLHTLYDKIRGKVGTEASIVFFVGVDGQDDGQSMAVTALAAVAGERSGATLLIDADIDRQYASRGFCCERAGLIESLSGQTCWNQTVRQTSFSQLSLLPCGIDIPFISPDADQAEFRRLASLADEWKRDFGMVVIDGGNADSPLVPMLAEISDGTFLCVQLGATRRTDVIETRKRLKSAGATFLGCLTTGSTVRPPMLRHGVEHQTSE